MHYLTDSIAFPPVHESEQDGLLAMGGDLSVKRLLLAYRSGIFPWFEEGQPILWWSPELRMVLKPAEIKISKSFRKTIRTHPYEIRYNTAFADVMNFCATMPRKGQLGTWITEDMQMAYQRMHALGHAHSVEVWQDDELVGGLYGIDLPEKRIFCGESMFSRVTDASKIAFYHLAKSLEAKHYQLIDCQMYTSHLESLGGYEMPREDFLRYLYS